MGTSNLILKKVNSTDLIGTLQIQYFNGKGKKKQVSLSLKLSEENFIKYYDKEFKQFRKTNQFDYVRYNNIIKEKLVDNIFEVSIIDKTYLLEYIKQRSLLVNNLNTREGYNVVYNHLKNYLSLKDITDIKLEKVSLDFLVEFKNHLTTLDISSSTILHYFIILKGILNYSSSEDLFNVNLKYLFKKLNLKTTNKIKNVLTNDDIIKLLTIPREYKFFDYVQVGLLQLFGMGMRQSDVFLMKIEDFKKDGISYTTKKNKKSLPIPYEDETLLTILFNILKLEKPKKLVYEMKNHNKFNSTYTRKDFNNYQELDKENYIQKLIDILLKHIKLTPKKNLLLRDIVSSDELEKYSKNMEMNELQMSKYKLICVKYNQILKYIKRDLELDIENLSSHSFRYTFTNLMLEEGYGIYEISQQLGHQNITITEHYINRNFDLNKIKGVNRKTFSRFNNPNNSGGSDIVIL